MKTVALVQQRNRAQANEARLGNDITFWRNGVCEDSYDLISQMLVILDLFFRSEVRKIQIRILIDDKGFVSLLLFELSFQGSRFGCATSDGDHLHGKANPDCHQHGKQNQMSERELHVQAIVRRGER